MDVKGKPEERVYQLSQNPNLRLQTKPPTFFSKSHLDDTKEILKEINEKSHPELKKELSADPADFDVEKPLQDIPACLG